MFKATILALSALAVASSSLNLRGMSPVCSQNGNCYLLRMQNFDGCGINGFTVHGLWPQWKQGCSQEQLDVNQLSSIRSDLEQYWPTCVGSDTLEGFWGHEWQKHGTCSGMDQLTYFSTVLSLAKQYRSNCSGPSGTDNCSVCFDQSLQTVEQCASSSAASIIFKALN